MFSKKYLFSSKFSLNIYIQRLFLNTSTVDIKSLRVFGDPEKISVDTIRIVGVPIRLNFYDSHRSDPSVRYNQSILPTVLLLPSSQYIIQDYSYMINELSIKYRVLALVFPGCEESKLLEDYIYYKNTPIQKTVIIHDFLNTLLPNRKMPLNFVVGFDENSHVLPLLGSATNQFYLGHKKLIMVNPAPPLYISDLKASKLLGLLSKTRLTQNYFAKKVNENIKKYFNEAINEQQMFQFFESWLSINEKSIDLASIILSTRLSDLEIYINKSDDFYDSKINNALKNSFEVQSGFKYFKFILDKNIDSLQKEIIKNSFNA